MSQTKPPGLLLATLVLFVLRVHSQGDRFRPDVRLGDESFRGPGPFDTFDYDEDEDPNFPYSYDGGGPGSEFPDEDYPESEEEVDDMYEDEDDVYPNYPRGRPCSNGGGNMCPPYGRHSFYGSSRYDRDPYRRRGYSRDWYDDDDSRSRRRDAYRRYDSDSGDRYNSRNQRTRNRGRGGYRKPHSYMDGGGSSRNKRLGSYKGASSSYGSRSQNSESSADLKEVAQRVRKLLGSLRKSNKKKENAPSQVINAM